MREIACENCVSREVEVIIESTLGERAKECGAVIERRPGGARHLIWLVWTERDKDSFRGALTPLAAELILNGYALGQKHAQQDALKRKE